MTSVVRGDDNFDSAIASRRSLIPGVEAPVSFLGSRSINTDYTNSSDRPRLVYVRGNNGTVGCALQVSYNSGSTWMVFAEGVVNTGVASATGNFTVPPGATYRVRSSSGTLVISEWWEQS